MPTMNLSFAGDPRGWVSENHIENRFVIQGIYGDINAVGMTTSICSKYVGI